MDRVEFLREARFETADGEVSGDGTLEFTLAALSVDDAVLAGQAPDVTLAEARCARSTWRSTPSSSTRWPNTSCMKTPAAFPRSNTGPE